MGLARHGFGEQGFSGAGRSYQQGSLGQLGADLDIASRIVKEIDDLDKGLLGLILTGYILEGDTGLFLHIFLGRALADPHDAAPAAHAAEEHTEQPPHQKDGEHIGQQEGHDHARTVGHIGIVSDLGIHKTLCKGILRLRHTRIERGIRILQMDLQTVGLHVDLRHLILLDIFDKFIVGDLAGFTVVSQKIADSSKGDDCHQQKNEEILSGLSAALLVSLVISLVSAVSFPVITVSPSVGFIILSASEKIKPADQAFFLIFCVSFYHMCDLVFSFHYVFFTIIFSRSRI